LLTLPLLFLLLLLLLQVPLPLGISAGWESGGGGGAASRAPLVAAARRPSTVVHPGGVDALPGAWLHVSDALPVLKQPAGGQRQGRRAFCCPSAATGGLSLPGAFARSF
jgi:hypothetical protein